MTPRKMPLDLTLKTSDVNAAAKLVALRLQKELLRRLREDLDRRKGEAKAAKERVEMASRDLERMVSDSNQGELFAGVLQVDRETGEITDYNPPDLEARDSAKEGE